MTRAVLLALVCAASTAAADRLTFDPQTVYKVPAGASPRVGPADAPITIVAWSDFACGYCNRVQFTLDQLERLYPGQIRWVHRTLPLDEDNTLAAEAGIAAFAQGKFRPMSDRIYAIGGHVDRAAVELIARELGMDMIRFRADLDSHAYRAQIDADVKDAVMLGVSGTPTFFINGRPVHGNQPLRVFADVVDEELARAAKTPGGYDALVAQGAVAADSSTDQVTAFALDNKQTYRMGLGLPGHQLGPDTALVTIVTWGDFQCPFCARMAPVLAAAHERYGNDVRIIYRHMAVRGHRDAQLAAEAAVAAADQGKFWAMHDRLFTPGAGHARADLELHAQAIGMDMAKFRAALDDRRYRDVVIAETAAAMALGVDGTPTMFINGQPVVGARSANDLYTVIDAHLAQARTAVKGGIGAQNVYALFMSQAVGSDRSDPSRVPAAMQITPHPADLARTVAAACRRRDAGKAIELAAGLAGADRNHAGLVCSSVGIDLPVARQ